MILYLLLSAGTLAPVAVFDVAGNEALGYAVIAALIALLPLVGSLVIMGIQQYGRIREAWAMAQTNHDTLVNHVLPAIEQSRAEGRVAHAETISAINGGIIPDTGHTDTGAN